MDESMQRSWIGKLILLLIVLIAIAVMALYAHAIMH
jgi:hypothetical protein